MEANYFTILYWFCHTSTWICHGCTRVPHPEPLSLLPPHTIPLGHPSAPAPRTPYHASNLGWWLISKMILYVSMPFSQIIPPSPSPTVCKRLFYTSVSLSLSHIQGYWYHLSKFHIYASEKAMALQYSCLENPWMEEPGRLQSMGSLRVGHDWATSPSLFSFMHWRRKWQPTPVLLPGKSMDGGAW